MKTEVHYNEKSYSYAKSIHRQISLDVPDYFFDEEEIYEDIQKAIHNDQEYLIHFKEEDLNENDIAHQYALYIDLSKNSIEESKTSVDKYIEKMVLETKEAVKEKQKINTKSKLTLVYITNNYRNFLMISQFKLNSTVKNEVESWKDTLKRELDHKSYSKSHLNFVSHFIQVNKTTQEILVGIDSRVKRATIKKLENLNIKGDIFTASLYDVTCLLGEFGNDLFKYNLRIHISGGANAVDTKITDTLKNSPEEFWYLNNGITILVDASNTHLRKASHLGFENITEISKEEIFSQLSVINGAQTISVATKYFLDLNINENDEILRKKSKKNSKVILRVVQGELNKKKENEAREWINKIAISLNRQKPIKTQDIVYNHYFVFALNEMKNYAVNDSDHEKYTFHISKRGETSSIKNKMYALDDVIRILHCYLGKQPGNARNSVNNLIQNDEFLMESEEDSVKRNKIENLRKADEVDSEEDSNDSNQNINNSDENKIYFGEKILLDSTKTISERHEIFYKEFFLKYYKHINLVMNLENGISKFIKTNNSTNKEKKENLLKKIDITLEKYNIDQHSYDLDVILTIIKYGKYHILSMFYEIISYLFNNKMDDHFDNKNSDDEIIKIILAFASPWADFVKQLEKYKTDQRLIYKIDPFKLKIQNEDYKKMTERSIRNYLELF